MSLSFLKAPQALFTSESISEGHPDKLCDQLSDAILDALLQQDPASRCAAECFATTGTILIGGEITTQAHVDYQQLARAVIREVGYTRAEYGLDAATCGVLVALKEQSPDIAQGVERALEARLGEAPEDPALAVGAGDQGMMIGFACTETPELMPLPIALAHRLCRRLAAVRKEGVLPYLRPDGKSQVTVEYAYGRPRRVAAVVLSAQHDPEVSWERLQRELREVVIEAVLGEWVDERTRYYINPTGRFVIGGPQGDAGLTGRKIIVDTYGGMAGHGGGAFSGKDPTKVDRSGAYAARYVAKNVVAAGLADRCEIQVSYAIGVARPISLFVETFGTGKVSNETLVKLINEYFDLRPAGIIQSLDLRRPIYQPTAAYGHFGRADIDAPWERLDKVDALRAAVGEQVTQTA